MLEKRKHSFICNFFIRTREHNNLFVFNKILQTLKLKNTKQERRKAMKKKAIEIFVIDSDYIYLTYKENKHEYKTECFKKKVTKNS